MSRSPPTQLLGWSAEAVASALQLGKTHHRVQVTQIYTNALVFPDFHGQRCGNMVPRPPLPDKRIRGGMRGCYVKGTRCRQLLPLLDASAEIRPFHGARTTTPHFSMQPFQYKG